MLVGGFISAMVGVVLFGSGAGVTGGEPGGISARVAINVGTTSTINQDYYAAALVMPVALSIVAALSRSWPLKVAGLFTLIVELYGIGVSGTRGAAIAVGVMLVFLLVVHPRRRQLGILMAGGGVAILPVLWVLIGRFNDPTQAEAGGRFPIWKIAYDAFRHHWLYGVGFGQFKWAYGESYLNVALSGKLIHRWAEDSHNLIANTSVELGIIGLAIVLAGWFFQWHATNIVPPTSQFFELRLGVEAAIIGLFIVGMTADQMWFKYVWMVFMLSVLVRNAAKAQMQSSSP
jgi:O-antigen ligase